MQEIPIAPFPPVGEAESGQKMLRFLERRLSLPQNLLHRWLRTGQIRLNGRRCKPFELVTAGDVVRLPPFAQKLSLETDTSEPPLPDGKEGLPPLVGASEAVWAFNKPAGLPVHAGTEQSDSIAGRLARQYANFAFRPAPAHRLDLATTGVLLVGATFPALQKLQADFRSGRIQKEYLAWVEGCWPYKKPVELRNYLDETGQMRREGGEGRKECICVAAPLKTGKDYSLLHILLLTGRKRQIRAQLAFLGYPVAGDRLYGAKFDASGLKLHSCRICLPDGTKFSCLPSWTGKTRVDSLPEEFEHLKTEE